MAPVLVVWGLGCAHASPAPALSIVQADQTALATEHRTRLQEPTRAIFAWSLNEAGMRVHGRGVARMEPPYRLRLDLFLENGETLAQAALVGDDIRIPPWAPAEVIPPPPLLWAALGVFRPGNGVPLVGGETLSETEIALHYLLSSEIQLRFKLTDGEVEEAELIRDGHVEERVRVVRADAANALHNATYRNLRAFRELRIALETVEHVEGFPPDIWYPAR